MRWKQLGGLVMGLTTVVAAATAEAQEGPIRAGLIGGFNSATAGGSDVEDADRLIGLLIGGYLVKPISGNLGLRVEGLYSQKGTETSFVDEGTSVKASLKLAYLEIPVLLHVEGTSTSGVTPFAYFGPSLGFNVSCDFEGSGGGASLSVGCDELDTDTEAFELAGVLGGGLAFPVGKLRMNAGLRYQHGFTDALKDVKAQNRVLGILIGIEFGGRK